MKTSILIKLLIHLLIYALCYWLNILMISKWDRRLVPRILLVLATCSVDIVPSSGIIRKIWINFAFSHGLALTNFQGVKSCCHYEGVNGHIWWQIQGVKRSIYMKQSRNKFRWYSKILSCSISSFWPPPSYCSEELFENKTNKVELCWGQPPS